MIHRVGAALLALALCAGSLHADDVYLKNGRKLSGQVTDLGDKIKLKLAGGITVTLSKDEIVRIIKKATPNIPKKAPPKKKPAAKKKPATPVKLNPTAETSFPTSSPQIESIEFRPDQKHVVLNSAGNVTAQIWDTRNWNLAHEHGLKVVFPKGGLDILCLKQSRGEYGVPVLHRMRDENSKNDVKFFGSTVQGMTCSDGVTWVAGWRGTFIIAWNRDKPEEPAYQKQAFRLKIYGVWCLPKKDMLVAHGDRSWITWDLKEGKKIQEVDYSKVDDFPYLGSVLSADRKVIVLWSRDRIATLDPETLDMKIGEELKIKLTKRAWLSSKGSWLAVAAEGPNSPREFPIAVLSVKTLKAVDMKANLAPISFPLPNSLFFSDDEKFFGANANRTEVAVVSTESWDEVASHALPGKQIVAGGLSPRGRQLLLADDKSHVYVVALKKE